MDQDTNEIDELKNKIEELETNWKRALADYRNLERRNEEEKHGIFDFAGQLLILEFLPILDNLEMLSKHLDDTGLRMVINEFKGLLESEGVKEIQSNDKTFDANEMDACDTVECEKEQNGKVLETIRKGYKIKDKVLRPATVKEGKERQN